MFVRYEIMTFGIHSDHLDIFCRHNAHATVSAILLICYQF